ncbi:MAG TPA: GNAT family N-acetyltransferase [Phycisphaerae bacterium]|nr:GNAT family N-acetyltransferase [Phycisphaerae bacterium]HRY70622.1 GNAT family N-acetyltransferase [Phycisphaerae bacterium]HSA28935.1 GNAT family N-acetyltransferase [Phycisphaerae bacterium]
MIDVRTYSGIETLKNGLVVTIRAIRPDDKAAVVEAFHKLEPESIYARFFQVKASLSNRELKAVTEVDFDNVVQLVVTLKSEGREIIIGGGRYVRLNRSDTRSAEIAFVVEEDYHGLGIAGRVLDHLTRIARDSGISHFEAEVLSKNRPMLAVFLRSGFPMKQTQTGDVIQVTLSLIDRP